LSAEGICLDSFDVARVGERHDELLVLDEVLDKEFTGVVDDAGPPGLFVLLLDCFQLRGDDSTKPNWVRENRFELRDGFTKLGHLGFELAAAEACKPPEGHVQDVVRLLLAERERILHEVRPRLRTVSRGADGRNDSIEHVDGAKQPLDDVSAGKRLAETELRTPRYDLDLVRHVGGKGLGEIQEPWHAIDEGEHVNTERGLQGCVLVEVVQDDICVRVPLQRDNQARHPTGRVVLHAADPGEIA